jgi:hypothetical protein
MTKQNMIFEIYKIICPNKLWWSPDKKVRLYNWDCMIWDVLDYIESWKSNSLQEFISDNITWVIQLWKEKRKPIEDQELSCISYIYSLIS